MSDEGIDLDDFDAPDRKDFRRIGRGKIPYVMGLDGKRQRYSRCSKAGDLLDDEYQLVDWRLRTALYGASQRPEIPALVSTLDPKRDKKQIRDLVEDCIVAGKGSERSIKGTAIHAMFDHMDRGDDWDPPSNFLDVCNAYLECLERFGLVAHPDEIEIQCVNDEFRLAGNADRRYRTTRNLLPPDGRMIPIGSYVIADTKTGDSLEYASGSYACQLAAYAGSMRYDSDTDERTPFDPPTYEDWGIVIHALADAGTCDAYWVDLNAGREGLRLARMVKAWRNRTDLITPAVPPLVPAVAIEAPAPPVPGLAPVAPVEAREAPGVREWLRGRVQTILAHSVGAGKALQLAWPVGVPGLKQEGQTADELSAIEHAIDRVETDFSIPFGATDPRVMANHPSNYHDRWAKPKNDDVTPTDQADAQRVAINAHPRKALLLKWVSEAVSGGIDSNIDTYALSNALYEFAMVDADVWPDDDLTIMLDGCMRAIGYDDGIRALGKFQPEHAPLLMSAAFSISAGTAILLFDEHDKPVVRTPV